MRLVWSRRALLDLRRIADHIAADNSHAAHALVGSIGTKGGQLVRFPLIGRSGVYGDTRELVVHRNYIVTYRVRADEVQMLQAWHAAQQRH
jgi:toxin ParE1/3/4